MSFHPLLLRQLRKLGWREGDSPLSSEQWSELLNRISRTYIEADQERYLLNRSQELASHEIEEICLRLSEAQHIAGLGNWVFDIQHDTGQWSEGCVQIFGMSCTTLIPSYSEFLKCIYYIDRERFVSAVGIALENGDSFEIELRAYQGQERVRWVHAKVQPFINPTGIATQIHGTVMDITERKKVETDLRIAAAAFESQESMMIADANGVILRVNQEFIRSTGYTAEECIGKTPSILKSGRHDDAFYAAMWASINRDGTWHGEIWDKRKNGEIFPKWLTISAVKSDDGAITHYVGSHIDITERKAADEAIKELAFFDPLTRLPNRRLLYDRLEHALAACVRNGREGALLFIDLDNFKTLNDTLGHNIGDLLLQQVARRLLSCVRDCDTVARLGGDEFVVMLEDFGSQSLEAATKAEAVGEKILYSLGQPYFIGSHECRSTPSIGATLFNSNHQQIDELLKQADIAMYQAKMAGRNTLRFFNPEMQETINVRSALEGELRTALEQQQFQLYYQIQVDSSHRPLGAEALIRWMHPERGTISPVQFIPLAEEIGLILPIGQWVLETACAQLKAWEQDVLTCNLSLSLNVSAKQFHQECFANQVQETIQRHGINPELLKLELTESMLVEDVEKTIYCMKRLNEIGIRFSLDDFGTGYSSLQYLKRLPLEQLKIDQSFVKDIAIDDNDKAIINTIIAMAHSMGINVIAEGVETEAQRQQLLRSKCNQFQGYLFSKPAPIELFNVHLLSLASGWMPSVIVKSVPALGCL